jgi:HEAT repeat protein
MKRKASKNHHRKTSQKLIRNALRYWGSDKAWRAIASLHMRGSPGTLELAQTLACSPSWRKRSLGLYIASQFRRRTSQALFGSAEYALDETQALLLAGLHDLHEEVITAAISGFGHRPHPDALPKLVQLSRHRNASIRFHVAVALGGYSEPTAIAAQILLARDEDSDVRDWATFGLGTLQEVDTPEVREVLWVNLHDKDSDVLGEALVGLAKRQDARAVDFLYEHLDENSRVYQLEAAELLASPRLLEPLLKLAETPGDVTYWRQHLDLAIAASSGASQQ